VLRVTVACRRRCVLRVTAGAAHRERGARRGEASVASSMAAAVNVADLNGRGCNVENKSIINTLIWMQGNTQAARAKIKIHRARSIDTQAAPVQNHRASALPCARSDAR